MTLKTIIEELAKDMKQLSKTPKENQKRMTLVSLLFIISLTFIMAFTIRQGNNPFLLIGLAYVVMGGITAILVYLTILKIFLPIFRSMTHSIMGQNFIISSLILSTGFSLSGYLIQIKYLIITSILFITFGIIQYPIIDKFQEMIEEKQEENKKFDYFMKHINIISSITSLLVLIIVIIILTKI